MATRKLLPDALVAVTSASFGAGGICATRLFASRAGPGDLQPIAPVPPSDYDRKAIIYKPGGPATQYGYDQKYMNGGEYAPWKIWFPTQEMWTNPLMGWASSSDTIESSMRKMTFRRAEDAATFLQQQGFRFEIEEKPLNFDPTYRPARFYTYGDNFSTKRSGVPDLDHLPSNRKKQGKRKAKE